jgi:thiol-disulfide isomerase/thioredoxin
MTDRIRGERLQKAAGITKIGLLFVCLTWMLSCIQPKQSFESIPEGPWRGVLLLDRMPVVKYGDDRDIKKNFDFDSELPFTFTIGRTGKDSLYAEFENGEEKIRIYDVFCGKATPSARDTFHVRFEAFDTYLSAVYEDGVLEGNWVVNYREKYMIPFKAVFGQNHRFVHKESKAEYNLAGKWQSLFEPGKKDEYPALGDFTQDGNEITGTFLTETGDYRYLHGNVIKNKVYLSAFDGAHAFLILAKFTHKDSLIGSFRSGKHYTADWMGFRNENFKLADPFGITKTQGNTKLDFTFPDTEGKTVSLSDDRFKNKIKLIQLTGTWCPNCLDETRMIQSYFSEKNPSDVAWISLAYERYTDQKKVMELLRRYKEKLNLRHDILWAGSYRKEEASKTLPQLSGITAYPTLLFVDADNDVRYIYTGFSGPATKEYESFKKEFENLIESVRHEK